MGKKKHSGWDMLVEAEKELRWARSDLLFILNNYLDKPEPSVWKNVEECGEQYAYWFNEVSRLREKVGQKLGATR
jgi:hypothetical protein